MPTVRLIPSTYYLSNSSYLSVSNAANMYANTDSTTHATVTNSRTSTSSYYIYVRGFNFDAVPSGAVVSGFTVKIKCNYSGGYSQAMYLYDGTSTSFGSSDSISSTVTTHTFSCSHSWEDVVAAGSDFGIRINCRRSSRNTTSYVYIYGAEIDVTYTLPVYHSVTINNSTSATVTASEANPLEGSDVTIRSNTLSGITIKDNNVDVTSQFVEKQDTGESYEVENVGTYGFTLNSSTGYYVSNNHGVDKSAAVCRVDFHVPVSATITFTYINYAEQGYDFGVFGNIDTALNNNYYSAGSSGATISDSSYKLACNTSSHNTSSAQTLTYNMSAGDHSIWVKYSKDDASASNNDTLQFKVAITLDEPFTPGTFYEYTISNITADHVIVVTQSGSTTTLYFKQNGSWVAASKVYKKINGSWVQQSDLTNVFESGTNYVKG